MIRTVKHHNESSSEKKGYSFWRKVRFGRPTEDIVLKAVKMKNAPKTVSASVVELILIREMRLYKRIAILNALILWVMMISFLILFWNYQIIFIS